MRRRDSNTPTQLCLVSISLRPRYPIVHFLTRVVPLSMNSSPPAIGKTHHQARLPRFQIPPLAEFPRLITYRCQPFVVLIHSLYLSCLKSIVQTYPGPPPPAPSSSSQYSSYPNVPPITPVTPGLGNSSLDLTSRSFLNPGLLEAEVARLKRELSAMELEEEQMRSRRQYTEQEAVASHTALYLRRLAEEGSRIQVPFSVSIFF